MEQQRKKELQAAYKARKPEMGVICFRWEATGESFLGASQDTQKDYNSNQFKLSMGGHPNRRMQALWNQYGPEAMTFSVLETLSYGDLVGKRSPGKKDLALTAARALWPGGFFRFYLPKSDFSVKQEEIVINIP